jgi:hypothetical protein
VTLAGHVTVVVLDACVTMSAPVPLLARKLLSAAKLAPTAVGYDPALIPLRLTFASVATPEALVVAVPTELPLSVKLIVLPPRPELPDVNVAVRVAVPLNAPPPLTALMAVGACAFTVIEKVPVLAVWFVSPG